MTTTPETGRVPSPLHDETRWEGFSSVMPPVDADRRKRFRVRPYPIGPDGLTEPERQLAATRALLDEAVGLIAGTLEALRCVAAGQEFRCRDAEDEHNVRGQLAAFLKKVEDNKC